MLTIEIKQIADDSAKSIGLSKYNRSKMPGCSESFQPTFGSDGRWITGLDELASGLRNIPDDKIRKAEVERIKTKRERLERLTGLNLSATNEEFWGNYLVKAKDRLTLDLNNPQDEIKYAILIANKFVANNNELGGPEFRNTKYYVSRSEEEASTKAAEQKLRDKARVFLYSLPDNKVRMTLVGQYLLGSEIKDNTSTDILYNKLSDYIAQENDKAGDKTRRFLALEGKSNEDLNYFLMAQNAIRYRVVTKPNGTYKRGGRDYDGAKDTEGVAAFLALPENIDEYDSVREELAEKRIYAS